MKKTFLLILTVTLFSFSTNQEKKFKFEFTPAETELIYEGLGELQSKRVEALRQKIVMEVNRQMADTTKKK